jgi:hypothetical protein
LVEADRQQGGEDRRRRDQDARQPRGDLLLGGGDEEERPGDLDRADQRQPGDPRAAGYGQRAGARGDRDQYQGGEGDSGPRHHRRREVPHADLDE